MFDSVKVGIHFKHRYAELSNVTLCELVDLDLDVHICCEGMEKINVWPAADAELYAS